ncbi:ATP-binding protein [Halapricum salinum]|uniref:ATP-binding protein n=1 Tax=Halapricum salinum TaxID=1457250 RepID=A0A4D6HCX7_9EURY|nr:AAA family ATPase [Halapricum salinum]QCC51411.1 ATP-binding protein [Halapricum salinum]
MSSDDIQEVLVRSLGDHNPWWQDGATALHDTLPARQKSDYYHLVRPNEGTTQFDDADVVGLVGRHGVGKTTLLKQFIHHELQTGTAPERFCYIPFDATALYQLHAADQFQQALRYYESRILGRLDDPAPHYLILDDVHRVAHSDKPGVEGWGSVVRDALEEDGRNIVVSAGATEQVRDELHRVGLESGSYDTQPILPEKFRDYIFTRYPDLEDGDTRVTPTPVREGDGSLPHALETGETAALVETLRDQHQRVADAARQLQSQVAHYLTLGGVLSYVADGDAVDASDVDADAYQLLYRNLTATLYQDAPSLESMRTIADLERLCALAARNRGRDPIRFQRLVELFDVDRRTIRDSYLAVLEKLFVLTSVTEYDNQRPRATRLYLRDTGLVSALENTGPRTALNDLDYEADLARIAAFDHTMRLAYGVNAAQGNPETPSVQYWRGRSGEVDYVFEVDDTPVPIALTYRGRHQDTKHDALDEFQDQYRAPVGFLVTGDAGNRLDPIAHREPGIIELPYWLYLMLC